MINWGELLNNLPIEVFLIIFGVIIFVAYIKSASFKGKIGELFIKNTNNKYLDKEIYTTHNDVTFKLNDGTSTQIDHIVTSKHGIFVIETKNYKGWIFGDEKSKKWTQSVRGGKKFQFQNPLHQNYKHTKGLQEVLNQNGILNIGNEKIISLVVFTGETTFKTKIPQNVFLGKKYIDYIKSFEKEIIAPSELKTIDKFINTKSEEKSRRTNKEHVKNLKNR